MAYTAQKTPFLHSELHDPSDPTELSAKNSVVLKWPEKQLAKPLDEDDDRKRAGDILRKLGYQQAPAAPAELSDDAPLLLVKRTSEKTALQQEIPAAIQAYDLALSTVREHFPLLLVKKTLNIAPFEQAAAALVDSLERNSDAAFCVSKLYEPNVYMYTHSVNVCIYVAAFALSCGKSRTEAINNGLAALLHDVGMALLPLALLQSSRELSLTEQVLVKRHPVIACELLSDMPNIHSNIFFAALEHHECYDGSGYPANLYGSGISFIGHLTAICSAFDAMTSQRRHRPPVTANAALGEMFKQRNKQFHPVILENFIKMLGVYPAGSVVILQDGYCGVVTASPRKSPTRPVVTLIRDPKGHPMPRLEFDMSQERLANIAKCVSATEAGVDIHDILGIPKKLAK